MCVVNFDGGGWCSKPPFVPPRTSRGREQVAGHPPLISLRSFAPPYASEGGGQPRGLPLRCVSAFVRWTFPPQAGETRSQPTPLDGRSVR